MAGAPGRVRSRLAGWPLRSRLVGLVLVLVAAGLLIAGVAAATALRGYLYAEVDQAAADVAARLSALPPAPAGQPSEDGIGPVRPGPVGDQVMFVQMHDASGTASTDPSADAWVTDPPALPAVSVEQAAAMAGQPYVVDSQSGDSRWRAVTVPLADWSGSVTVAAEVSRIDATVHRLVVLEVAIGVLVLLVVGLAASVLVRRSLRPLVDVEHAAAAIAAGDLSRRAPFPDPRTEVGSLAVSFNTMVDEVQSAFVAQLASERAARESAQAAVASEARMRQFVADASHELRTPLTSVRGFAELYRMGAVPPGERLDETIGRIEAEAARMGVLVDDLLLLARLDQQRPLERGPVDALAVAADAVVAARATAPGRQVLLESGPGDPPVVNGDELRLRQVMDNLLSNALRYSPAGEPVVVRVAVDTGPGAPAGGVALVSVIDRGPGMTAEQAARAFERFYRGDRARSRGEGGNGLGLAIVAAIAAAHDGHVRVRTEPGAGATFEVALPLAVPAPAGAGEHLAALTPG